MKGIYRFMISLAIVLAGLFVVDVSVGIVGDKLLLNIPNSNDELSIINYSMSQLTSEMIIIGASRAKYHYNVPMMIDSLGLSMYNLGIGASGFGQNACILHCVLQHHTPKVVVFDAYEEVINGSHNNRIMRLAPYYHQNAYIHQSINNDLGRRSRICLRSNLYRYNSRLSGIINAYLAPADTLFGYKSLTPKENRSNAQPPIINTIPNVDSVAYRHFTDIINWSKQYDFKLIVVDSPRYVINEKNYSIIRPICEQNGIMCIDNSNLPYFMEHTELFHDANHLNNKGADIYTSYFIEQIKPLFADIR